MTNVAYITNAVPNSGVGSRAENIKNELIRRFNGEKNQNEKWELTPYYIDGNQGTVLKNNDQVSSLKKWPGIFGSKTINWIRSGTKVQDDITKTKCDIVHATNQSLGFLINGKVPSVVTVHDIIELLNPQSRFGGLLSRYLYRGIMRADHIITVSEYTASSIQKHLDISREDITVIPNGVGSEFHRIDNFDQTVANQLWRQNLKLNPSTKIILYVGSEHPRKNLDTAFEAFARARADVADIIFIKVGDSGISEGRKNTLNKIEQLDIRNAVRMIGNVSNEDLNSLYNLADIFIYPSKFEGFGLPPLQAMAAGTPVIVSNATSLPEVVGDAALSHDPLDIESFTQSIVRLLSDSKLYHDMQKRGLNRVKLFSWASAAETELMVYKKVLSIRQ